MKYSITLAMLKNYEGKSGRIDKMWTVLKVEFDLKDADKNISKVGKLLKSFEEFGVSECRLEVSLETSQDLRNKEVTVVKKKEETQNTV